MLYAASAPALQASLFRFRYPKDTFQAAKADSLEIEYPNFSTAFGWQHTLIFAIMQHSGTSKTAECRSQPFKKTFSFMHVNGKYGTQCMSGFGSGLGGSPTFYKINTHPTLYALTLPSQQQHV